MTIDNVIQNIQRRIQDFTNYPGEREQFKKHAAKTVAGAASIYLLAQLNAPDLIETATYIFTAYQGFKKYKDFKVL